MLIGRVNQSQIECIEARNVLKICELKQDVANSRVTKLQSQLKSAIKASRYTREKIVQWNFVFVVLFFSHCFSMGSWQVLPSTQKKIHLNIDHKNILHIIISHINFNDFHYFLPTNFPLILVSIYEEILCWSIFVHTNSICFFRELTFVVLVFLIFNSK